MSQSEEQKRKVIAKHGDDVVWLPDGTVVSGGLMAELESIIDEDDAAEGKPPVVLKSTPHSSPLPPGYKEFLP